MRWDFWRRPAEGAAPPNPRGPWDRNWDIESFKCPLCGAWGVQFTMNGYPMLECAASALNRCRVSSFKPTYWPDASTAPGTGATVGPSALTADGPVERSERRTK